MPSLGLGNSRPSLGQTLIQGVPEPREPREGAIRKPSQRRWDFQVEGKSRQVEGAVWARLAVGVLWAAGTSLERPGMAGKGDETSSTRNKRL